MLTPAVVARKRSHVQRLRRRCVVALEVEEERLLLAPRSVSS
jgi:hypothetical protein